MWNKVSDSIEKEIDGELMYNKTFLKAKIKTYDDQTTDFSDKEMSKGGSGHISLAVITINSVLEKDDKYYPRAFWKECKYVEKEKSQ